MLLRRHQRILRLTRVEACVLYDHRDIRHEHTGVVGTALNSLLGTQERDSESSVAPVSASRS